MNGGTTEAQTAADVSPLLASGLAIFAQLEEFLVSVPSTIYSAPSDLGGAGSVGAHVRHALDHLDALARGLTTRSIHYDRRERDRRTERDSAYALRRLRAAEIVLRALSASDVGSLGVSVHVMFDANRPHDTVELASNLARELHFVISHFTHHMATIALVAGSMGALVPVDFGKALATIASDRGVGSG